MSDHDDRERAALYGDYEVEKPDSSLESTDPDVVAACRFCEATFSNSVNEHRHHCHDRDYPPWEADGSENKDFEPGYLLKAGYHEFKAYLKYDFGEEPGDMTPYFGLNSLQKEHDFSEDGALVRDIEIDDDPWVVEFSFKNSGLKPWDHPDFKLSNVREYIVKVRPKGVENHKDALRRATFVISPRWPNMESLGDSANPSNPHDIVGVDVEMNGSGIPFLAYPDLFHRAMGALEQAQGVRYDNPTYIDSDRVAPSEYHHSSNVIDAELYVRIAEEYAGSLYAIDGPLHRLSLLLSDERRGYAKSIRDDREREGHYHTATIGSMRSGEFIANHRLGKEIKQYFIKHPDAVDGALANPKLGVSMQHKYTEDTVYFDEMDSIERELDETLLSVLNIAGLPTTPDHQIYVEDDVFEATGERRLRKIVGDDALPRLQAEQDAATEVAIQNASEVDSEIWGELFADGGEVAPKDLAERLGRNLDHIYKRLQKMSDVIHHEYGRVSFVSQYVAQTVWQRIEHVEQAIEADLEGAVHDLMESHRVADEDSWWGRLRNQYGATISNQDDDEWGQYELDVGYRAQDDQEAKQIAKRFAQAFPDAATTSSFLKKVQIHVPTIEGSDLTLPRFGSKYRVLEIR